MNEMNVDTHDRSCCRNRYQRISDHDDILEFDGDSDEAVQAPPGVPMTQTTADNKEVQKKRALPSGKSRAPQKIHEVNDICMSEACMYLDDGDDRMLCTVTEAGDEHMRKMGYRKHTSAVDSGAVDNVVGPHGFAHVNIKETLASRQGKTFFSAIGDPIRNLGEQLVTVLTKEGHKGTLKCRSPRT